MNLVRFAAPAVASAVLLTGCVANAAPDQPAAPGSGQLQATITADSCEVSAASVTSGATTFAITNSAAQTSEFYLLGSDGLRIVAEKEGIAPGSVVQLTVSLQPGDYFTACKPGMRGENVGEAAFTVTGAEIELTGEDAELFNAAVVSYVDFVQNEVAALQPKVEQLAAAYAAGKDAKARDLFPTTRVHYERIEPIAEAVGILDARIDYREIDYLAEAQALAADDPSFNQWLGFHRMEKDLWVPAKTAVQPDGTSAWEGWQPSTAAQRKQIAAALNADVEQLYDLVHAEDFIASQGLDIATVSNGASALLEEIAVGKVTGEEDWWSHTDLYDFQGNLQGARIAFDLVAPIAERRGEEGAELVRQIDTEFTALQQQLSQYGSLESGFVGYDTVDREGQRELVEQIDATRTPLSRLTGTVLGIQAGQ